MASIFKRITRKGKKAAKYTIKYRDQNGRYRIKAGCADLESTRRLAAKLESDVTLRRNGVVPDSDQRQQLPLRPFQTHLEAQGDCESHVTLTISQLESIFTGCGFATLSDLREPDAADKVKLYLLNKKRTSKRRPLKSAPKRVRKAKELPPEECGPISPRTANSYLAALKSFCKWCVRTGKMPDCPLLHIPRMKGTSDNVKRRAATAAELAKIVKAAAGGGITYGLTGQQRAYLYLVAANTGFRASELRSLTRGSFNLKSKPPYVQLAASKAKNRKETQQPLPADLAEVLAAWFCGMRAGETLWPATWHTKAAQMLRIDLKAAKVPETTKDGALDFHALRVTFITSLARAGVHPKTAQQLARHSDINLTMKVYTQLSLQETASVLPNAHQGRGSLGQLLSLPVTSTDAQPA